MDDDPYAILEVSPEASAAELKKAYRRAALRWHPDRNPGDPTAADRFKRVARAWEVIGEAGKRRAHDARRAASATGGVPDEFLDAMADAVERAQRWTEEVVVPHYASMFRGRGGEMAARWIRALEGAPPVPGAFEPEITWRGRWRARRWLRDAVVRFDEDRWQASSLHLRRRGFVIGLSPAAMWSAGYRGPLGGDATELDDAVLRLLLARYAVALSARRFDPPRSDDPGAWDHAIARARAADSRAVRDDLLWKGVLAAVVALIAFMFLSASQGW
jgi:hypothetical protein